MEDVTNSLSSAPPSDKSSDEEDEKDEEEKVGFAVIVLVCVWGQERAFDKEWQNCWFELLYHVWVPNWTHTYSKTGLVYQKWIWMYMTFFFQSNAVQVIKNILGIFSSTKRTTFIIIFIFYNQQYINILCNFWWGMAVLVFF